MWYREEWKECPGCDTLYDVPNIFGDDPDLLAKIYAVNLPLWLQHSDAVSQLRAAVYDQDLVRLVHGSPWGVVCTPSRERLLKMTALRLDAIRDQTCVNRNTTRIVIGVPGCGKKFFVKLLVAALTIFLNPVTCYWGSLRNRLPQFRFNPYSEEDVLVFGFEDMSNLQRMNCEHSRALWSFLKGSMKRELTVGFIVESRQTWPETFFQSRERFSPLNNTVVDCFVYEPLLTTADYSDFFRVLGTERPPFATLELLHFWTGGRLSRLFDLFGGGPVVPPKVLADVLPLFPSKYACSPPFKFEERVAWVHLAILNSSLKKLSSSGAIFELPVFQVDEIEDVLVDDEQKAGDWLKISLEHVLTEQRDFHCSFRLVNPHLQLHAPPRPPQATVMREFQESLPTMITFVGSGVSHSRLARLLEKHGGPTDSDDLSTYFERWLSQVSPERQQAALFSIFEIDRGNTSDFRQDWPVLFRSNRPVVVEGFDFDAARELFQLVNGRPGELEELSSVILTWESPLSELALFFKGRGKRKVLYINGCVLPSNGQEAKQNAGNWLIGSRHSIASESYGWCFIKEHLLSCPVVVVGCEGAVRNSIMQTKIHDVIFQQQQKSSSSSSSVLFRVVKRRLPHIPFIRDLTYTTRQEYFDLLWSLFS